ncbi:hypothetical protein KKC04_01985 [Patescibacteria group bacterium]|nr:hypothetical protein [Patescibacteria group bacterium]
MFSEHDQLHQEYQALAERKQEFDLELEKAKTKAETPKEAQAALQKAKELQAELEQKRDALREKLWPFEALPQKELQEQYESQKEMFEKVGILEKLSTGKLGIKAIDNQEYAFPSYQEITKRIRENKETLKTKTEQGFNQLLIVPFGLKLDDLIEKYKQVILKHYKEGKLFATKENTQDPDEPLELNENQPVWTWDKYQNADTNEDLVYFPQEFSENHQGKIKEQILKQTNQGFNILLLEDLPNIPRQGQGKEIKGRKQLEAGLTPNQYLETLKTNPNYQNETGITPEEQIICAIKHLEQTNQVIDDYSGKGSASYQLGAYFTADGFVPSAYWYRDGRQANVDRRDPEFSNSGIGVRAGVRV